MRLTTIIAIFLMPLAVKGQELGEPLIGPEIVAQTVQIERSDDVNCVLQDTGSVFCWDRRLFLTFSFEDFSPDVGGFSELNAVLNNDIARITLNNVLLCGIGRESGIACVNTRNPSSVLSLVRTPPEPDASYLSISNLNPFGGCLLYTSPSPRDATLSRMPSSA